MIFKTAELLDIVQEGCRASGYNLEIKMWPDDTKRWEVKISTETDEYIHESYRLYLCLLAAEIWLQEDTLKIMNDNLAGEI